MMFLAARIVDGMVVGIFTVGGLATTQITLTILVGTLSAASDLGSNIIPFILLLREPMSSEFYVTNVLADMGEVMLCDLRS